jgi:hypothetical protein
MPVPEETKRGGTTGYRTIRVGKGKNRRYVHVAIVRKAGPRGGHTVAGQPKKYERTTNG